MSNDLTKPATSNLGAPINQDAQKIYNIQEIKHFTNQVQIMTSSGLPGSPGYKATPLSFSRDYYNLVIFGQDPFNEYNCHITLQKNRCLVEEDNIAPELKKKYSPLSPEAIEELKTFPCILANENRHYGWADEDQYASFAQLQEIKKRENGIELYFHQLFVIPQARISEHLDELGICGKYKRFNELNHSHWTVKAINLCEVLSDASLLPF